MDSVIKLETNSLLELLDHLREELVKGSLDDFISLGMLIGGMGAILYISYRVWRSMANAEPIDIFPLFRPFVMALLILNFNTLVIPVMDGIVESITAVFERVSEGSEDELKAKEAEYRKLQDEAMKSDQKAKNYILGPEEHPDGKQESLTQKFLRQVGNALTSPFRLTADLLLEVIEQGLRWLFNGIYWAAKHLIYVMATFSLIILALIGPLVFGISCFDGFSSGYLGWIAKYVNISLWFPITSLYSFMLDQIQIIVLDLDIQAMSQAGGDAGFSSGNSLLMIVFYIIGAFAYATIPSTANWIVEAGSASAGATRAATSMVSSVAGAATFAVGGAAGKLMGAKMMDGAKRQTQ